MKNPPMRMLILLAVFWAAGTLLLAAESPSTPKPAATATKTTDAAKTDAAKADAAKADATKTGPADTKDASASGDKDSGKDSGTASSKGSIAEQAEAALKAAAETDAGGASKAPPPKSDAEDSEQHANDDTQTPPTGKGPSPQRFVPTEQVRADFDVSFPIDI
jgi:hypothetical protein